jgi:hypothetical protein
LVFPPIEAKILKAKLLSGGEAKVIQTEQAIAVIVPQKYQQELVTVIRLDLDRPAITLQPRQGLEVSDTESTCIQCLPEQSFFRCR